MVGASGGFRPRPRLDGGVARLRPHTLEWHGLTELIVLCMTLFIARSEHRDMQTINAKLDEILRVHGADRRAIVDLDHREPEEIEEHREDVRRER